MNLPPGAARTHQSVVRKLKAQLQALTTTNAELESKLMTMARVKARKGARNVLRRAPPGLSSANPIDLDADDTAKHPGPSAPTIVSFDEQSNSYHDPIVID